MKKLLLLLCFLILPVLVLGQTNYAYQQVIVGQIAIGANTGSNIIGTGAAFHKLTWTVSGTVSTCTVAVDSSVDGVSWSAGGALANQTCTSNGNATSSSTPVNFVRINLTVLSGAGATVNFNLTGYINNPAGGGSLPTGLTYVAPTFTISSAGNGSAILALSGNTSGTATITAPATAGTLANAIISSNNIQIGTAGQGTSSGALSLAGLTSGTASITAPAVAGTATNPIVVTNSIQIPSGTVYNWNADTGLSRLAGGSVAVGNGTAGTVTGLFSAAAFLTRGTKFTTNAGCGESAGTITASATAGAITTAGTTSCSTTITFGNSAAGQVGWACHALDLTTAADANNPHETSSTTTTATIASGTIVSGDVIQVDCIGY